MRRRYCILLILLSLTGYSQLLDLIVTKSLDSIACRIDSITEDKIFFEFKSRNDWIHTSLTKESIVEYSPSLIDSKKVVFKAGTSTILSPSDYHTNQAFYFEGAAVIFWSTLGINYERVIWNANDYLHFNFRTGILLVTTNGEGLGLPLNLTILTGKLKHYFEFTAGYAPLLFFTQTGEYLHFGIIGLG